MRMPTHQLVVQVVQDLVGLLQRVFANGIEGLFAVPGAAIGSPQPRHDFDRLLKQGSRPLRIGCGLRRGSLRAEAFRRKVHASPVYLARERRRWLLRLSDYSTTWFWLKGTGFSPYIKSSYGMGALAPEGCFSGNSLGAPCPIHAPFFWRMGGKPQISPRSLIRDRILNLAHDSHSRNDLCRPVGSGLR